MPAIRIVASILPLSLDLEPILVAISLSLIENKFIFLGCQACGHQALSVLSKGTKSGTIRQNLALSGIFRQNQGHDVHDLP